MNRVALLAVAAGVFGGTLLVAAIKGSILGVAFGVMFSALPLAMAVLALGPAALPVAVMGGAVTVTILTGSFVGPVVYFLNDVLPIAVLMRWAQTTQGNERVGGSALGISLTCLGLAAVALMVFVLAMMPLGPDGLEATLKTGVEKALAEVVKANGGAPQVVDAAATLQASAAVLPGAAGWNWCLRAIVSAALAQAMLSRLGHALQPAPAYRHMAVPSWFIAVFWAIGAVAWFAPGDAGFVARNAAAVLCLPLLLQGLTVVHSGIGRMEKASFWLVGFYVMALLTAALSFVVLVSLGVVDHFLKLRERMTAPPQGGV